MPVRPTTCELSIIRNRVLKENAVSDGGSIALRIETADRILRDCVILHNGVTDTGGGVVTPKFSFGAQLFVTYLFARIDSEFGGALHAIDSAVGVECFFELTRWTTRPTPRHELDSGSVLVAAHRLTVFRWGVRVDDVRPLSVVLGCISMVSILPMFICFWVAIVGLVFGGIGYKDRRGMAIAGIILSSLGLFRSALLAIAKAGG